MTRAGVALCHLRRRPGQALLLMLGLAAAAASVVGMVAVAEAAGASMARQMREGQRLVVTPPRQEWDFTYAGFTLARPAEAGPRDLPADVPGRIRQVEGVAVVAPKLLALVPGPGGDALAVGVEWEAERAVRGYWQVSGRYPQADDEVLLGPYLAAQWGVGPGGRVSLWDRPYRVAGVLAETGRDEDGVLLLSLAELRKRTGRPGGLTFVEVRARPGADPTDELKALLPDAEVTAVRTEGEARAELLDRAGAALPPVMAVALAAGLLLAGTTQASRTRERTREVGLLRALGYSGRQVLEVLLLEVLLLGGAGGLVGYLAGVGAARALLGWLDPASPAAAWDAGRAALTCATTAAVALAGASLPAHRAARTDPARALRFL